MSAMNCSEAERLFDAYLDGELNGSLRFEFDAHRLNCPMCQRKLAMMEACEHILVGDQRGPALSADFTDRVMAQVSLRGERVRRSRHLKLFIGAAVGLQAAAAVGFFFVWTFGQDRQVAAPRRDPPPIVRIDPAEYQRALDDKSGVLMYDLVWNALQRARADVQGVTNYAANLKVPQHLADAGAWNPLHWLFSGDDTPAEDAPADPADPLKL